MSLLSPVRGPLKLAFRSLVAVTIVGVMAGCSSDRDERADDGATRVTVMATTPIWADIVGSVVCNRIDVESVMPPGSDAHDFELSMRGADRVLETGLLIANGLELEASLSPLFARAAELHIPVVELGSELPADDPVIDGDPHIWMDPGNVRALIPVISSAVASLDVMGEEELASCAAAYESTIDDLLTDMARTMAAIPDDRRNIVAEHQNLGYFAGRFGLDLLGSMVDSSSSLAETDARHLEALRATMQRVGASTVFVDAASSDAAASAFVADVDPSGSVVPLYIETMPNDTSEGRYIEMMRTNAGRVASALGE